MPTPTPRIAPKCIKEIARLIATSVQSKQFLMMLNLILLTKANQDDALTGGNKNFSADAEKNAEGKDDGAKDAVKPLPKQGIRCYPAQQVHRKIYAVAEGEQCYQLAQQLTPVNLPQQDWLGNNKKQIQDNSYFTDAPGCKHTQNPWYTGNGRGA